MEQRASLGSLPLELQSAILRTLCSSLTTITRDTARVSRAPRQKDLATLGSTSRHWHRVSRPFLWADPLLLSETSLRAFLACLLSTPSVGQLVVRLNLGHFVLSPGELEFLASKTPSLQTLYLKCPPAALGAKTSDAAAALERLMSHTPRLQRLSIELARETETTDLQKQATSGSGSFSTISSPGAVKHTGALGWSPAALPCTMNVLRHLTHLDLYMVNAGMYQSFYELVSESVSQLVFLNLGRTAITDSLLSQFLSRSPQLSSLWLEENFAMTDAPLRVMAQSCPLLHTIKMRNCSELSDEGLIPLVKNLGSNLRTLGISYTRATSNTLLALVKYCPRLHSLLMNDVQVEDENVLLRLIDSPIGSNLRLLAMSGMDCLTDATLERIGSVCHLLEKLDVSFCGEEGKLTDAGLRSLLKLSPTLVHLVFSGIDGVSMVTEAELEYRFNINQFWIEAPLP